MLRPSPSRLALFLALLAGAPSRPVGAATPCASVAAGKTPGETLERVKGACGAALLVTTAKGLEVQTPDLRPVAQLVAGAVRLVTPDRSTLTLYYFAPRRPDLHELDLKTGKDRLVARLPLATHSCFREGGDAVDPVSRVQASADFSVDVKRGAACLVARDRNVNMMSGEMTYKIPLRGGRVDARLTFLGSECAGTAKAEQPPCSVLARPSPPSAATPAALRGLAKLPGVALEGTSSGGWTVVTDSSLGDQGDYIYRRVFVADARGKLLAVTPARLRPLDLLAARKQRRAPAGTCLVVGEDQLRWLPGTDALLVDRCRGDGSDRTDQASPILVVRPPDPPKRSAAASVVVY